MERCRFHPKLLDFDQGESHFRVFHQILGRQSCSKHNHTDWESCKNGKNGKCRFHPQILDFGQIESHFRDFHQIPGKTVVFNAKIRKIWKVAKMEKWENAVFTLNYWILIRKNHIFVIFIKFWVCLKQKFEKFGKLQKWKNGKTPFSPSTIGF
jgi:hypothetical protein